MKVLDLFCGGGGASMGMLKVGATHITGVDIEYQPEYPANNLFHSGSFDFILSDFWQLDPDSLKGFDFIWASPPCQAYSYAAARWRNSGREWPDLVGMTREKLLESGIPFVIENTPGALIRKDLMLCGEMFGLKVIRHRIFEVEGFECVQPEHIKHRGMVKDGYYVTVAGHGGDYAGHNFCKLNDLPGENQLQTWQYAMGIDWISDKKTLREAVPPAYSGYIFSQFLRGLEGSDG
jgi:DNA (cytosine-5)-methyltransferase 1